MRTLNVIRAEIDETIGLDVVHSAIADQIRMGRRNLARNLAESLAMQLKQATDLSSLEIHTAVMTIIMMELYDSHTNIHFLIPREIVDSVDQALSPQS